MNLIREEIDRIKNLMNGGLLSEAASNSQKQQALLQIIRQAEHSEKNWDKAYYTIYGSKQVAPPVHNKRLDQMTLSRWLTYKDSDGVKFPYRVDQFNSKASGAYQFMPATLRDMRGRGWVSDTDVMSKQKQDSIVLNWLKSSSIGIDIDNLPDELNIDITDRLALKWAAIPSSKHGGGSAMENQGSKKWSTINKWYTSLIGSSQTVFDPYDGIDDGSTIVDPDSLIITPDNEYYYPEIDSEEDESVGPIDVTDILDGDDVLKRGDESNLVSHIQNLLVYDYDYDLGDSGDSDDGTDGAFGKKTEKAIKEFQKKNGIPDDGIIGLCTLDAILEGHTHYCCKEDHCEEDECSASKWCEEKPEGKERTKKSNKKKCVDDGNCDDKENVIPNNNVNITNKGACTRNEVTAGGGLPDNFAKIPAGTDNYRCDQPTMSQLKYILQQYDIKYVIRLNSTTKGVTALCEKTLVESMGIGYVSTLENASKHYISGHNGGVYGKGYIGTLNKTLKYLQKGNTLIHCAHGADRTGYIVAKYLQDELGWNAEQLWDYTIKYNSWENGGKNANGYICAPHEVKRYGGGYGNWGYIKYMEAFYPLKSWCEAGGSSDNRYGTLRKDCYSCKNQNKLKSHY